MAASSDEYAGLVSCHRRPRCPEAIPSRDGVMAKQASACNWAGLLVIVPGERPIRLSGDDRFHGKRQRAGRSASSVRTAELHSRAPTTHARFDTGRGDGGWVGELDQTLGIHDPDLLRDGLQHSGEETLGSDPQTSEMVWGLRPVARTHRPSGDHD
jgi:hypothetical protein